MNASVDDFLNMARGFIGIAEDPDGSNMTPLGDEYGMNGVPWCAISLSVALQRLGFPQQSAAVGRWIQAARTGDDGMSYIDGYQTTEQAGWLRTYDWNGRGNWNDFHIEAVEVPVQDNDGAHAITLGGNVDDRFGRWSRSGFGVSGYIVLPFSDAQAPVVTPPPAGGGESEVQGNAVVDMPLCQLNSTGRAVGMIQHAFPELRQDNEYGEKTETSVTGFQSDVHQVNSGFSVDGAFGNQSWMAYLQGGLTLAGHPCTRDGVTGPETTGALVAYQQEKGLTVDAVAGYETFGALTGV